MRVSAYLNEAESAFYFGLTLTRADKGTSHSDYHEGQGYDSVRSDKQVGAVAPRKGEKGKRMKIYIAILMMPVMAYILYKATE